MATPGEGLRYMFIDKATDRWFELEELPRSGVRTGGWVVKVPFDPSDKEARMSEGGWVTLVRLPVKLRYKAAVMQAIEAVDRHYGKYGSS